MSEPVISSVWYPVDDPVQPFIAHAVGRNGVTRIELVSYSPEPYCTRELIRVFEGDCLRWQLDTRGAGIEFARPDPSPRESVHPTERKP